MRKKLAAMAKKVLPARFVNWYRRRRALRRYLRTLAYELYDRQVRIQLDDLEGRIAARRDGFYEQLVKDVLERTDLILQELDRRLEGLTVRHGRDIRGLRDDVAALRASVETHALGPLAMDPEPGTERAPEPAPTEPSPAGVRGSAD